MVDQVDWSGAEHSLEEGRLMRHWLVDWRVRGGGGGRGGGDGMGRRVQEVRERRTADIVDVW